MIADQQRRIKQAKKWKFDPVATLNAISTHHQQGEEG